MILPNEGIEPEFASPLARAGIGTSVLGRVTLGRHAWLGDYSVVRADGHFVKAGDDLHLGPRSTLHIAHGIFPCIVGDRLTVGRNACVHACTVGNDVVVGDNCTILDGSTTGDNVVFEKGSTVYPGKVVPGGYLYAGSPAKPVRALAPGEAERWRARMIDAHAKLSASGQPCQRPSAAAQIDTSVFIARTATVMGRIEAAASASIFFSNIIDAGRATIALGARTNIQDNTVIRCRGKGVRIGADTTIGHNVTIHDCIIGNGSLIGIGSTVSPGTVIEDDVLLAANAKTESGQVLTGGKLWAGDPARAIAPLDEGKRALIAIIIPHYVAYAAAYKSAQEQLACPTQATP
jgi:carbonic anhydrase/acetyltransferase-like protein (isoleucine patch superfamily)